jgi:hypothetical protein
VMNGACSRCSLACQCQDSEESSGGFGKMCGVLFLSCGMVHPLNCCPLSGNLIGQLPGSHPLLCPQFHFTRETVRSCAY